MAADGAPRANLTHRRRLLGRRVESFRPTTLLARRQPASRLMARWYQTSKPRCLRRHPRAIRAPHAAIRPGSPAPTIRPGTAAPPPPIIPPALVSRTAALFAVAMISDPVSKNPRTNEPCASGLRILNVGTRWIISADVHGMRSRSAKMLAAGSSPAQGALISNFDGNARPPPRLPGPEDHPSFFTVIQSTGVPRI